VRRVKVKEEGGVIVITIHHHGRLVSLLASFDAPGGHAGTLEERARRSWRREATASLEKGTCVIVTDFGERRIVGSMPPPRPTPASESDCDDRRGERAVMGMAETSEFRGVAWRVVVAVPFEKRRD